MTNPSLVLVVSKAKEAEAPMVKRSSLVSFNATVMFIQKSLQTAQKPRYKRLFVAEWNSKASSTLTAGAAIMVLSMLVTVSIFGLIIVRMNLPEAVTTSTALKVSGGTQKRACIDSVAWLQLHLTCILKSVSLDSITGVRISVV